MNLQYRGRSRFHKLSHLPLHQSSDKHKVSSGRIVDLALDVILRLSLESFNMVSFKSYITLIWRIFEAY